MTYPLKTYPIRGALRTKQDLLSGDSSAACNRGLVLTLITDIQSKRVRQIDKAYARLSQQFCNMMRHKYNFLLLYSGQMKRGTSVSQRLDLSFCIVTGIQAMTTRHTAPFCMWAPHLRPSEALCMSRVLQVGYC